jgi:DNA-directed RNA polymerase specialized sigma24 family protein
VKWQLPAIADFTGRLAAARAGDEHMRLALVWEFQPILMRCLRGYRDPLREGKIAADDLVQSTLIKAAESFSFSGATPEQLVGWLIISLHRRAINAGARFRRGATRAARELPLETVHTLPSRELTPIDRLVDEEDAALRRRALDELDEADFVIVALHACGCPDKEALAITGIMTVPALRCRRQRIVAGLRAKVEFG